jgi:hypothetical protein
MSRTTIASIEESGWSFRVVRDFEDVERLSDHWLEAERKSAVEKMKLAQRLIRGEVRKTLGRMLARPSRANEPPRAITKSLLKSWRLGSRRWNRDKSMLTGKVESPHPAAGALEFGAVKSLGFGPRPYYRITLARIADQLGDLLEGDYEGS